MKLKYCLLLISIILVVGCGGDKKLQKLKFGVVESSLVGRSFSDWYVRQWNPYGKFPCGKAIGEYRTICSNGGYKYEH